MKQDDSSFLLTHLTLFFFINAKIYGKWKLIKPRSPEIKAHDSGCTEGIENYVFYTNVTSKFGAKCVCWTFFSERVNAAWSNAGSVIDYLWQLSAKFSLTYSTILVSTVQRIVFVVYIVNECLISLSNWQFNAFCVLNWFDQSIYLLYIRHIYCAELSKTIYYRNFKHAWKVCASLPVMTTPLFRGFLVFFLIKLRHLKTKVFFFQKRRLALFY